MITLLVVMCALQLLTLGAIFYLMSRLASLEVHVIELKVWMVTQNLRERREADELEELRFGCGSDEHPWGCNCGREPGRGTVQ